MGDKGKGGIKNFKKWVTSFMDGPCVEINDFLTYQLDIMNYFFSKSDDDMTENRHFVKW